MTAFEHDTPFAQSLRIQGRVIGALLMREILTRYGRHNIGFLWVFFEPMMFTLGITALWTLTTATHGSSLPITEFAITGYSSVLVWRNCASRCALAIQPNLSLMYHRNVRVADLFMTRILLELVGATTSFVVLSITFIFLGVMSPPHNITLILGGWIYLCMLGTGLGFLIGALSERSETIDRVWHTIAYLMFPLSGAVFMVDWLPVAAQRIVYWIPMVHGTEMLRAGYFGNIVKPHYDVEYMLFASTLLLLTALLFVRDTGTRVEPQQ